MKIAVRYYTKSGNTEKLAKAISEAVGCPACDVSVPLSEKVDVLFLGSSVYAAGVAEEIKAFLSDNKERISMIVNFSTAALLPSTYKQVSRLAEKNGIRMSQSEFHCRGSFAVMHKGKPDAEDCKAAAEFAKKVLG